MSKRIHVGLSDIEPDFVYTACGKRGAESRPKILAGRYGYWLVPWTRGHDHSKLGGLLSF